MHYKEIHGSACIKSAAHACLIHTCRQKNPPKNKKHWCLFLFNDPGQGGGGVCWSRSLVGIPEHPLAGEERRRSYYCVALRAMKMISKMTPHTSATMFSILAVLEASVATVVSPTALAFWTLKEGKCPNECVWSYLPSIAGVSDHKTAPTLQE